MMEWGRSGLVAAALMLSGCVTSSPSVYDRVMGPGSHYASSTTKVGNGFMGNQQRFRPLRSTRYGYAISMHHSRMQFGFDQRLESVSVNGVTTPHRYITTKRHRWARTLWDGNPNDSFDLVIVLDAAQFADAARRGARVDARWRARTVTADIPAASFAEVDAGPVQPMDPSAGEAVIGTAASGPARGPVATPTPTTTDGGVAPIPFDGTVRAAM